MNESPIQSSRNPKIDLQLYPKTDIPLLLNLASTLTTQSYENIAKPKEGKPKSADLGMTIELDEVRLQVIMDGVGSSADVESKDSLQNAIESEEAMSILSQIGKAQHYQGFLFEIDNYLKAVFEAFKKDAEKEPAKRYNIAASFAFTNHNIGETVVAQIGDTMIFNIAGDIIVPLDNCLYTAEKEAINNLIQTNNLPPTDLNLTPDSLVDKQLKRIKVDSADYKKEVLNMIIDHINMAIVQINVSRKPNDDELYQELVLRGFDINNKYLQTVLKTIFDNCDVLNLYHYGSNVLSNGFRASQSQVDYRIHRLEYNEILIMTTDGIENGAISSNPPEIYLDFRKLIPTLLRDSRVRAELGEKGGLKRDDLEIIIPITMSLLEYLISTVGSLDKRQ